MTRSKRSGCGGCLQAAYGGFVRLVLMYVTLVFFLGMLLLWRVPVAAARNRVEQLDVLVRCLDTHLDDPLWFLQGYRDVVARVKLPALAGDNGTGARVETVQKGPNAYEHTVWEAPPGQPSRPTATVTATTPHTAIPVDELQVARRGVDTLYPPAEQPARGQVLRWGEALFVRWWSAQAIPFAIEPVRGTEEEHLWFAWQRLTAGSALAAEDVPRLAALMELAYPGEEERAAALEWAGALHARVEDAWQQQQARTRAVAASLGTAAQSAGAALPPRTDTTGAWLLYQYVGLTDASRQAARARWLSLFGRGGPEVTLHWGGELERERRAAGESLPPPGEGAALLCVAERLTGTDDYGLRSRRAVPEVLGTNAFLDLGGRMALQFAYPNDDLFYLLAGGNPLGLGFAAEAGDPEAGNVSAAVNSIYLLVMVPILSLGLGYWVFGVFGNWVLWLRRNPRFVEYRQHRSRPGWKGLLLCYALVPLLTWGIAWYTLSEPLRVLIPTPLHLLAGVYVSVLVGGTVLLWINRVIALVFIRLGYDVEKIWLDDLLGLLAGTAVLWYFDNDLVSIVAFVAFAVVLEVLPQLRRAAKESSVPAPPRLPA